MLILFAITCALYRWDQAQWEVNNGTVVNDRWSVEIADAYEGYLIPGWADAVFYLQSPGWGLGAALTNGNPLRLHTDTNAAQYFAEAVSIVIVWFLIGLWCDRTTPAVVSP
jgi:hypothetical protein